MNYNYYRTQIDNQNAIHSNSQSVGKLKKGIVFQNYPFNPVQSYNSNMQVRPFTSQTQPLKKPFNCSSNQNQIMESPFIMFLEQQLHKLKDNQIYCFLSNQIIMRWKQNKVNDI
ncbi:unnamed protein product (macronuclear) [Paramecium tetraurelia]|uniref:Uncharacterized protein n=1 Tax=Paramecium tetraurelia TaxID=5888 RepID=A0D522_PARTE|nr:uncharacterized protein GSPATT00013586001 [Paramecium tetraurelia]CAK78139.1 unnamed protein product [Paramecium tetraurelia]|eukprot:XP_001445536.1 hypothetical protein (macronuclear) [Paramecium tetraurelia strain d4-2]